jgi:polar amino acid transport system substrate-binding protein
MLYSFRLWRGRGMLVSMVTIIVLLVSSFLFPACATMPTVSSTNNTLGLLVPGTLTVASDTSHPPMEFIDDKTQQVDGFDIDLIAAIGHHLGLKVTILTTKIELLLSDLANYRYDVAISDIPITPDRQVQANLIPYFISGESLLVRASNPHHIHGLADLCGQVVGVQDSSRAQVDAQNASAICQQTGKPAIAFTVLKNQISLVQLLAEQQVVATFQDSVTTDYLMKLYPGQFAPGSPLINTSIEGIALRKDNNALTAAILTTLKALKSDGTYSQLIAKWGLHNEAVGTQ